MKAKKLWILIVGLGFLSIAFAPVGTEDTDEKAIRKEVKELLQEAEKQLTLLEMDDDVRNLAGLNGVLIAVDFSENQKRYGLTKEQVRIDFEQQLSQNNIKVIPDYAYLNYLHNVREAGPNQIPTPTWALLCVEVDYISDDPLPICTYRTGIRVSQLVTLMRDKDIFCMAITWSTDAVGVARTAIFADAVRKNLKHYLDEFINDYVAANPKQKKDK